MFDFMYVSHIDKDGLVMWNPKHFLHTHQITNPQIYFFWRQKKSPVCSLKNFVMKINVVAEMVNTIFERVYKSFSRLCESRSEHFVAILSLFLILIKAFMRHKFQYYFVFSQLAFQFFRLT